MAGQELTRTVVVRNTTSVRQSVGFTSFEPGEAKEIPERFAETILGYPGFEAGDREAHPRDDQNILSRVPVGPRAPLANAIRHVMFPDPSSPPWIEEFNRDVFPCQTAEFDRIEPAENPFSVVFRLYTLDEMNGGAQVILRICGYLSSRGHDVTLSVMTTALTQQDFGEMSVRVIRGSWEADFIVGTYWTTINEITKGSLSGRRVALVQSDEPSWLGEDDRWKAEALRAFAHPDVDYIAISKQVADACVSKYGTNCRRWINGNGVDCLDFSPRINHFQRRNAVCAIYRGAWFKNDAFVLRLMEDLKANVPGLKATMAGFKRLQHPVLDEFLHSPPVDEMAMFYSSSDFYLSASKIEGSPLPPLEAMACGCIPVVSRIGTCEYLVDGENGFVIDPDNYDKALQTVLDVYADEDLRQAVIRNGLATARQRTWESVGAQFEGALIAIQEGT